MEPSFRMSIGANLGEVAKVNAAFATFAGTHGLPTAIRRSIHVVLDELLANTVRHGFAGVADGTASVEVILHEDRLAVTLTDNGVAFNPFARAAPDTTLSVEERPIGGLGIHLVRRMMDAVRYERRDDRNVVILSKRLSAGPNHDHRGGRGMQISTRTQGDITIVAIAGNLDSASSPEAQRALDAAVTAGGRKVAVDFSALEYISSAGLRVMLGTAKQLRANGGALRTFGLNQTVHEVFEISGFASILTLFPTEAEALAGF